MHLASPKRASPGAFVFLVDLAQHPNQHPRKGAMTRGIEPRAPY